MFELVSIRQQKKNPNYYWVKLSWHGLTFNWGTYRHDEHRYLPPAMLMNKRWVTTVEVPLNRQYEIVAMCQEAVSGKIFDTEEAEETINAVFDRSAQERARGEFVELVEFKESVKQNKELLTKLAKPEPVADDEGPYGLGPCLSGEEYEALSELNKAIHVLNMNQKRKKYEPRLTDAGIKDSFMDNFPDREDLFFAAQEAIAICAKK